MAKAQGALAEDDPRHGTLNGYDRWGCRCPGCRRANTEAHRDYMDRRPEQREKHRERSHTHHVLRMQLRQVERDLQAERARAADLERVLGLMIKLYTSDG